jgi:hypothetical protein
MHSVKKIVFCLQAKRSERKRRSPTKRKLRAFEKEVAVVLLNLSSSTARSSEDNRRD